MKMKTNRFCTALASPIYNILPLLIAGLVSLHSCDSFDWDPIEWETTPPGLEKKDNIQVPPDGSNYVLASQNYPGFMYINMWWDDEHHTSLSMNKNDVSAFLVKDWFSVRLDHNIITVAIYGNDSPLNRKLDIGICAGDIFDGFTFIQNGK